MTIPAEAPDKTADASNPADTPTPAARRRMRLADLGPRVISGLVLIAAAVISLRSDFLVFFLTWLAASLVVHLEWQRVVGGRRLLWRVAFGSAAVIGAGLLAETISAPLAVIVLGLGALANIYLSEDGRRMWSGVGVFYAGSLIIGLSVLRQSYPFGHRAIGWLFAVIWSTDIIAYFAGRLIGGPRFLPQISPSKTWAGTLAGILGGAGVGTLFLIGWGQMTQLETPASPFVLFVLGLATAIVAQAGDLFESWAKRCFGKKDSSHLIPGHGGLMDRLDGFIAAVVWVTLLGVVHTIVRPFPSVAQALFHWM